MTKRTAVLRAGLNEVWDFQSLGFSILTGPSAYELFYPSHEDLPLKIMSLLLLIQIKSPTLFCSLYNLVRGRTQSVCSAWCCSSAVLASSSQPGREEGRAHFSKCFNKTTLFLPWEQNLLSWQAPSCPLDWGLTSPGPLPGSFPAATGSAEPGACFHGIPDLLHLEGTSWGHPV